MKKVINWLWRWKWLVLVVALAIGGYGYYIRAQTAKNKIETVTPQVRDIIEALAVSGNVDAREKASLKFAAASKLSWIKIKEGDTVKKWQAIAGVDARQLQKQMELDQNLHGIQFRAMEDSFDTNQYFGAQGLTDQERRKVEDAQLQTRNSALTVEIADISVKNATMLSPIEGIVTQIDQPNVGAVVMPTDTIGIVNPHSEFFAVIVDEADIGKVSASQAAQLTLDAYPEETLNSYVQKIAFTPSQSQSGGLGYRVDLQLPDGQRSPKYRLGMSGDAKIVLNSKQAVLSIPTDAIVERQGVKSVDVLRNKKPEKVTITTGITDGDFTEVLSGLTAQDQVIMPSSGK